MSDRTFDLQNLFMDKIKYLPELRGAHYISLTKFEIQNSITEIWSEYTFIYLSIF
jgi:hypothetical protein